MSAKRKRLRRNIVELCRELIDGATDFVSGSRALRKLYLEVPDTEKTMFFPIIGFESETDDYSLGEERKKYDQESLKKLDYQMADYTLRAKHSVLAACQTLIKFYA